MRYWYVIIAMLLTGCGKDLLEPEPVDRGTLPISPYVAIGGSETAGFADGALHLEAQQYSYPSLIAQQLNLVGNVSFLQPLTVDTGGYAYINGLLYSKLELGYSTDCNGVESLAPVRGNVDGGTLDNLGSVSQAGPYGNWGVPFLKTSEINEASLSSNSTYYRRFGAGSTTFLQAVSNRSPTLFTIWLGMQDIMGNIISNEPEVAPIQFFNNITPLLDSLTADTTAAGFIATIPDVTTFPFFNTIPYNALTLEQPLADALNQAYAGTGMTFQAGPNAFVIEDPNAPGGKRQIKPTEKLLLILPLDSVKCLFLGSLTPISARYVVDEAELLLIRNQVDNYNLFIWNMAQDKGLAVVDVNALYKQLASGVFVNGAEFNNELVNGGFFSLDGINPSKRGAALIANEFIKVMNDKYRATIPLVSVVKTPGIKFP